MKHPAMLVLLVGAAVVEAQDFAYRIELAVTGERAAYRAALPPEVHRGVTRADFADVRVVNGAGEAVPFTLVSGAPRAQAADLRVTPPLFPVFRESGDAPAKLDLQVRQNADGTLISLATSSGKPAAGAPRPAAYWLVDTSLLKLPMRGLKLEWRADQQLMAGLRVEAGDDLASWRTLAGRAPLVDLNAGAQSLRQDTVEFAPVRARYLRLTLESQGAPVRFDAVNVMLAGEAPEPPRARVSAVGTAAGAQDIEFDLGGAFAVERVGFGLPQQNTLAPAEILVRDDPGAAWRPLARTVVYRLAAPVAGGDALLSPPHPVGTTVARYWLLRLDPKSGGVGAGAVRLEADYAARHVVFVARGAGPFGIEYGRRARAGEKPASAGPSLALPTLLPGYREGDEWKLPEASTGKVVAVNPGAVDKTLASEFDLKKSALWAMLVAAVLVLGAMAWRLLRDSPPSKKE